MDILMAATYYRIEVSPHVQPTTKMRDTITNRGMEGGRTLVSLPPKSGGQGADNMREAPTPVTPRNNIS